MSVYSARIDTTSTARAFAARSKEPASSSILSKESANNATKGTRWSTANAQRCKKKASKTSAAPPGKKESARNAQNAGTSPTASALPSAISAQPGTTAEPAFPATMDTKFKLVPAWSMTTASLWPTAIFFARRGMELPAFSARIEVTSTLKESATQSARSATPSKKLQATASLALRDMISKTESALALTLIMPSPLILGAEPGTGINKSARNALATGSSMRTRSACLFLINARAVLRMEPVIAATLDMTSSKENAFSVVSTMLFLLAQVAEPGTGQTKPALSAQNDGSSIMKTSVCLFLTNASLTLIMATVLPVLKDTTSKMANVSSLTLTTQSPQIPAAELGTGPTNNA